MDKAEKFFCEGVVDLSEYRYFLQDGEEDSTGNFPQEFFDIIDFMKADGPHDCFKVTFYGNNLEIIGKRNGESGCSELVVRLRDRKIKIRVMELIHQREGRMTKLYNYLVSIRKKYNLEKIIVEACNTEDSKKWCEKNGLIPYSEQVDCYIEP